MNLLNGTPQLEPDDLHLDLNLRPWQIEDAGHDSYLLPEAETGVGMPRVIDPVLEATVGGGDWDLMGRFPMTWWVGDGRGAIARTPWGEPMMRASAWVEREGHPQHRVWMIADGCLDGDEVRLLRSTLAISSAVTHDDREGFRWVHKVLENPAPYFFAQRSPALHEHLEDDAERPDFVRDIFRSARRLAQLTDLSNYPPALEGLLEVFRGDARGGEISRTDEHFAALGLHFVLIRAMREPSPDEKMPTPYAILGESLGKSAAAARKYVTEAEKRGLLTEAKRGTGNRSLTAKGQNLIPGLLVGRDGGDDE